MKTYVDEDWDDNGKQIGKRYCVHDCPFCGSKKTDLYQIQVQCERCDAHGPKVDENNWPMAITLWNELPREKGEALKKLRHRWESLARKIRQMERKTAAARREREKEMRAPHEAQKREYREWAAKREAWLHAPVKENGT